MIDWLVRRIFSWKPLYEAVTEEVELYKEINKRLTDNTPGSAYWDDGDGWRSWSYNKERKKYYFNDIPEENLGDAIRYALQSIGPEFDIDEVW
jgi:hypothetical protein